MISKDEPDDEPILSTVSSNDGSAGDTKERKDAASAPEAKPQPAKDKISRRRRAGRNVRSHCGQSYTWWLLGIALFLSIVIPLIFTVIIPAMIQYFANRQPIIVRGVDFTVISPNEFNLTVDVGLDLPLPVMLYQLQPQIYNYYDDDVTAFTPIFNISVPETKLGQGSTLHIPEQTVSFSNQTEFVSLVRRVWRDEPFPVSVRASATVGLSKLVGSAHLERTIHIGGLEGVDGLLVDSVGLVLEPGESGENLKGAFALPNRMPVKFSVGRIVVDILIADTRVAVVTIDDTVAPPGNVILPFHGKLFLPDILANLGSILSSETDALRRGNIDVNVTGNANTIDGQTIAWLETFLRGVVITLPIPVMKLVGDVAGSLLDSSGASFGGALETVFRNQTLLGQIAGHWEKADNVKRGLKSSSLLQPFGGGAVLLQMLQSRFNASSGM